VSKFADYAPDADRPPPLTAADGLVVRPAEADDLEAIAELFAVREDAPVEAGRALFAKRLDDVRAGRAFVVVAQVAGRVVGYGKAELFAPPPDAPTNVAPAGWYLAGVVVDPAHRRRGVGLALTAARLDWIGGRSGKAWYFANVRNLATIDLHRALGFIEATRDFSFPGVTFEGGVGILFVRDLRRPGPFPGS
jgi:ribosomal protein S18 acetylase RimI-like enzyme